MMAFLAALRVLTTIAALMVGMSPLPDFWRIHKMQTTGEVSILPITLLFCNSFMWAIYGYKTGNIFPVLVVNMYGMSTSVVFSSIFYRWSTDRESIHKLWKQAACMLAAGSLYVIVGGCGATGQTPDQVVATLGFFAVVINIALYASPLANMKKVIQTKDASSLPIAICTVFLGNALLWVLYALTVGDMFVMVPNLLGMILCVAQVALYIVYRPGRMQTTDQSTDVCKAKQSTKGHQSAWGSFLYQRKKIEPNADMPTFLFILRVLTTATAILVGIAPLPNFWRIHKNRSTNEVSILPTVMLFCNCYVFILYSHLVGNISLLFAVTLFNYVFKLCGVALLLLAIDTVYYFLGIKGVTNQSDSVVEKTLGFICITFNVALYASPLETMEKVIQTKSAPSLPNSISFIFMVDAPL
ncbi:hypothetical protein JM16_004830 [Phytophthora kernoviae]|uniref:Sugar transporter SWEET1 n=1 Tax=Phytophthora kernoviae TaxID=325452 RepID=A0A8T0LWD4_9STRA|nr:hypothetical protein JM16_004830 [Phytophthora kernoviae]